MFGVWTGPKATKLVLIIILNLNSENWKLFISFHVYPKFKCKIMIELIFRLFLFIQMRMSYDDQYLFTVSEDASLFIFKAVDKEGRGMKRDKEVGYAEEILITKSDLEEKVRTKLVTV